MRFSFFTLNFLLINFVFGQTPTLGWANGMGGTSYDEGRSITTDLNGNIYITGFFTGTVDFDPGLGVTNLTVSGSSSNRSDIFIQKLDSNNNLIWAKRIGGNQYDICNSISIDSNGDLILVGAFTGSVDFDPGIGVTNLTTNGNTDIFILKLDSNGLFIWAKQLIGTDDDEANSVTTDLNNDILVTGFFRSTVDFDPGFGILNATALGFAYNIFILKLDANGNLIWAKQTFSPSGQSGNSITTDLIGNMYITGHFSGSVDFDPGIGVFILSSNYNSSSQDIFILKLDINGNFRWAKNMGGNIDDYGHSISAVGNNQIYLAGGFRGIADFDPHLSGTNFLTSNGSSDIFIQKIDSNGTSLWVKQMGGISRDEAFSINTETSGYIYITGIFADTIDLNPNIGVNNFYTNGVTDIFVQKLDTNGNFIWAKQMGGPGKDFANSITTNGNDFIYTTGYFESTVDFDPNITVSNLTSTGRYDIFVQQLNNSLSVGSKERSYLEKMQIYPNPSVSNFSIDLGTNYKFVNISITDLAGRLIQTKKYYNSKLLNLNIEGSKGVYLLKIESDSKKAVIRLIKK